MNEKPAQQDTSANVGITPIFQSLPGSRHGTPVTFAKDKMSQVTIDFVTIRPDGSYCLRLLEEGPWESEALEELRRIQDRLYDVIGVVADGKFAALYPASKGKRVFIKLDCFRVPRESIDPFFGRLVTALRSSEEWAPVCEPLIFEINHLGETEGEQATTGNDGKASLPSAEPEARRP